MKTKTVVFIAACICLVVISMKIKENKKVELLKQEYANMLEESLSQVFDDPTCKEHHLAKVDYAVTGIKKQKTSYGERTYNVSVVIDCTSPDCHEGLLAYAVEKHVPGYFEEITMSTGDIIELRNENMDDEFYGDQMLTVNVNGERVHGPEALIRPSKNKKVKKCPVCGREFEMGTEDSWSITMNNMCKQCDKNYEYAIELRDELKQGN